VVLLVAGVISLYVAQTYPLMGVAGVVGVGFGIVLIPRGVLGRPRTRYESGPE
jgi:hypothetical protein